MQSTLYTPSRTATAASSRNCRTFRAAPCLSARHRSLTLRVCAAQKVSELPGSLQKIVGAFQMVPDPMARYKQLLFYATKLDKLPKEDQIPANKVEGCVSQVWVKPELREGRIYWKAESDSQLTKGLAALLVQGLSGCTPQEIITLQPDFIEMLGLKQSLTPSRNNGFLNMLKLMQRKTLELMATQAAAASANHDCGTTIKATQQQAKAGEASSSGNGNGNGGSSDSNSSTPIQDGMRRKITEALKPARLDIEDQSAAHAGHAAMRAAPGKAGASVETHFKVSIVSEAFEGKNLVTRQRMVYGLLQEEFGKGLHALSLDTKTPAEVTETVNA